MSAEYELCKSYLEQGDAMDASGFLSWFDAHKEGDWIKEKDEFGNTPLYNALENDASEKVVSALIAAWPGAVKEKDNNGYTPLHYALRKKALEAVMLPLILACPDAAKEKDKDGSYPLHYALENDASEAVVKAIVAAWPAAAEETGGASENAALGPGSNAAPAPAPAPAPASAAPAPTASSVKSGTMPHSDGAVVAGLQKLAEEIVRLKGDLAAEQAAHVKTKAAVEAERAAHILTKEELSVTNDYVEELEAAVEAGGGSEPATRAAAAAAAAGATKSSTKVIKCGWITKKGAGTFGKMSWKRRWFVLQGDGADGVDGALSYYRSEGDERPVNVHGVPLATLQHARGCWSGASYCLVGLQSNPPAPFHSGGLHFDLC